MTVSHNNDCLFMKVTTHPCFMIHLFFFRPEIGQVAVLSQNHESLYDSLQFSGIFSIS